MVRRPAPLVKRRAHCSAHSSVHGRSEWKALLPFIERICTEQILMEVHGDLLLWGEISRAGGANASYYGPFADFMKRLAHVYEPFYGEYNPGCIPSVRCFEISWRRRTPCGSGW